MEMYLYQAVGERLLRDDVGEYTTYGIMLTRDGAMIDYVADVTCDYAMARRMAESFTLHQLSPLHLYDAIEDFLFDGSLD